MDAKQRQEVLTRAVLELDEIEQRRDELARRRAAVIDRVRRLRRIAPAPTASGRSLSAYP